MKQMRSAGGWAAIKYTLRMANRVGWLRLWKAMQAKNACKTCALGMGGQKGGMRNEAGHWPEVCKKSFQAMVGDMQAGLTPGFFQRYSIAQLQTLSPRELEDCGRLTQPLYAGPGDTHYRVIEWDDALQRVATSLKKAAPDESFFYVSGRSSNEAGFLLQLFGRLLGTNYVHNCSFYCHQASGVGLGRSLGTGTATLTLDDVEHSDLFFLIGGNPASNHPRMMRTLMTVRRRGGKVVVINPVKELGLVNFSVPSDIRSLFFGSKIASHYVQPHIGGDIALMLGIAKEVLARGAEDKDFIAKSTEHFAAFRELVERTSWESIVEGSGVSREQITEIAQVYCRAKRVSFGWTMGITHHTHGVANVQTIVNLALLRGMVGRQYSGLLPIRGHSNVQGIGSMGVAPALKPAIADRMEEFLGIRLPKTPGLDTMACMDAAARGEMRNALCLGGNLFGSNPDSIFAHQSLAKLDLVAYMSTSLNWGHAWGLGKETVILPVLARDEECQSTTQESMFNYVRLSDGGKARHQGPRGETDVIASLGRLLFGESSPVNWPSMHDHEAIRKTIAKIVPGYEPLATIGETKQEFQIEGRTFHRAHFPTPSGKAQFAAHAIPPLPGSGRELRMMTVRSEGQFNTVVYEDADIYRNQERRDVILMNEEDINRLGLKADQRVTVLNEIGALHGILVRKFDIRAGNALMYYPEANVLVSKTIDPESKTPAFKSVLVTLEPQSLASRDLLSSSQTFVQLATQQKLAPVVSR